MTSTSAQPPSPAALSQLRPTDGAGATVALSCIAGTASGIALSLSSRWWVWAVGQLVFALSLIQWFALLHECGHETLFRTKGLHAPLGHIAGFFTLIPFRNWKSVHRRHHKWTGWQDIDPTTEALVPRELGRAERVIVNAVWRCWIPLFSVIYRTNNFWNWRRLTALFEKRDERRALALNMALLLAAYVAIIALLGPSTTLRLFGLASIATFAAEDLLILSQHTHIPQQVSDGGPVRPFPTVEQETFTRSLVFPRWLSALLLHIDAHELHHMYPFVPGYRLGEVEYETENEVGLLAWIKGAHALPGELLLFHNRLETGADI
jgi:acyl-lipid omega-6 desaturase (Delta-12 desaturase)